MQVASPNLSELARLLDATDLAFLHTLEIVDLSLDHDQRLDRLTRFGLIRQVSQAAKLPAYCTTELGKEVLAYLKTSNGHIE
jgi:hypothetical protein